MTTLSSSTMKASAEYSTSSAVSISVRRGSPLPPYRFCDLLDLGAHDGSSGPRRLAAGAPTALSALAPVGQLLLDDENLEPRQPVDLELEDGVGLLGVEAEPRHDALAPRRPCPPIAG